MTNKKALKQHETACQDIARVFMEKYYKGVECNFWWVGGTVGEILVINDQFWNMNHMVQALSYNAPGKKLFEWYEASCDEEHEHYNINLKNFLIFKK